MGGRKHIPKLHTGKGGESPHNLECGVNRVPKLGEKKTNQKLEKQNGIKGKASTAGE